MHNVLELFFFGNKSKNDPVPVIDFREASSRWRAHMKTAEKSNWIADFTFLEVYKTVVQVRVDCD